MKNLGLLIANILYTFNDMSTLRSRLDKGNAIIICGDKTGALINSCSPFLNDLVEYEYDDKYGIYTGVLHGSIDKRTLSAARYHTFRLVYRRF